MNLDNFLSYKSVLARVVCFLGVGMLFGGCALKEIAPYDIVVLFIGIVVLYIVIDSIISKIMTQNVSKYGYRKLIAEMKQDNAVLFEKNTYVTEHFVINKVHRPYVTEISEIIELEYKLSRGALIYGIMNNGKKVPVAKVTDEKSAEKLISIIKDRNRNIV